jgi:hypothetical protein
MTRIVRIIVVLILINLPMLTIAYLATTEAGRSVMKSLAGPWSRFIEGWVLWIVFGLAYQAIGAVVIKIWGDDWFGDEKN